MLHRRGRPTSIELLLLVVVSKLSLPLSCHPPLRLHHLLRLVGATRALMPLACVEVLQVGGPVTATGVVVVGHGMRSVRAATQHAAVCEEHQYIMLLPAKASGKPRVTHRGLAALWLGRGAEATHVVLAVQTSCRS